MIGNCSRSEIRSSAYGIAQALVALARACGPTYGGSLFAWSATNGKKWPMDFHFTFYMCSFTVLAAMLSSTILPDSVNLKLVESDESGHSAKKSSS